MVFQEFLTRKEDYLKALRGFLREVIRQVRNEFNFLTFSRSLMQERQEVEFTQLDPTHKVMHLRLNCCRMHLECSF